MNPSIGRIVHYLESSDNGHQQLRAAIITLVGNDAVQLTVFTPHGGSYAAYCSEGTEPGMWRWPEMV